MKTYRYSTYSLDFAGFFLTLFASMVLSILAFGVIGYFIHKVFWLKGDLTSSAWYLIGIALIVLVLVLSRIVIDLYTLSYKLTINEDGKIIETQWFSEKREIDAAEISELRYGFIGAPALDLSSLLLRLFRKQVNKSLETTPQWVGLRDALTYGIEMINSRYLSFPKYPVSLNLAEDLSRFRPDLAIANLPPERMDKAKQIRQGSPILTMLPLVVFALIFGFVWFGFKFFFILIIVGFVLLILWKSGYLNKK
jgi:hypothetical protein